MDPVLISGVLYLFNMIISLLLVLTIIHRLYISKKFSKEKDFHLYNDLFSWEMFSILIGIANIFTIITLVIQLPVVISIIIIKIIIFLWFSCFWNKIIHFEKIMNKITYERHEKVAGIPCIFIIIVLLLDLPLILLLFIFLLGALIPYLIMVWLLKNNFASKARTIKTFIGTVLIGLGCIFLPNLWNFFIESSELINLLIILSPIFYLLGNFFIESSELINLLIILSPIFYLLGIFFIFIGIYNELFR